MPEELWKEINNIIQEAVIKTIPKKYKKAKKKKKVFWGGLTDSWEKKKNAKEKRKDIIDLNAEYQE